MTANQKVPFLQSPLKKMISRSLEAERLTRYSKKAQLICDMLTRSLCFLWMLAATIRSSIEIRTSYLMQESGTDFRAPFWPMRVIMTLGFLILALALLSNAIDCYRKLRAGGKS